MPEEKKNWKREVSAGGVVYKKQNDQLFILLVLTAGVTETREQKWTFPKGWVGAENKGESMQEAALREVKEEGGVEAEIRQDLGEVKYFYKFEGQNIFKIVRWYLMEYKSGDPKDHDHEVLEAKWFTLEEAEKTIVYKTDKEIFEKAKKFLVL